MSSMLEQAIIDANDLKEAAVKNAEAEILEKYSNEIKEAVSALLEQEEELEDELVMDEEEEPSPEDEEVVDQLPSAATGGENLCPCPDDDEVVEIDFTELVQKMDGEGEEIVAEDLVDRDELAEDVEIESELRENEEIDIKEEDLRDLVEELVFDIEPQANGWLANTDAEFAENKELLRVKAELEEKEEKSKDLEENLKAFKSENSKFKRIILELKDKLDEVSLTNARYLYTNRVLTNASLNERQKTNIVESLANADTIEGAKVIFETLQSAVGGSNQRRKPKSLDEAVERKSSRLLYHNSEKKEISDPSVERMQRLAGIQTN
jgi:hypothetical protein